MIEVRRIGPERREDVKLKNQPFSLFGRMVPSCANGTWSYTVERFSELGEMCFPDEDYDYESMAGNSVFLGAYDGDVCIGLAVLQDSFFRYMYLYDLKVNAEYRGHGAAKLLLWKAEETAREKGYRGIYTIGQDNNLGACLFYVKNGFCIGGFDNHVYRGTKQEGKADIIFYRDNSLK